MKAIGLNVTTGLSSSFIFTFSYGFVTSFYFWRRDRLNFGGQNVLRIFVLFLGLPMIATTIALLGPDEKASTWLRYLYSAIEIAFLFYLVPVVISATIFFVKKKSPHRWLYVTGVFGLFSLLTTAQLLLYFASRF